KLHPRRLQVASEVTLKKLGMEFAPVWEGPMEESVTANGEITYHPRAVATLGSPLAGKIWRVEKDLGQPVKKGDVVALVDAVEVGRAKIDFLKTLSQLNLKTQTLERIKPLVP